MRKAAPAENSGADPAPLPKMTGYGVNSENQPSIVWKISCFYDSVSEIHEFSYKIIRSTVESTKLGHFKQALVKGPFIVDYHNEALHYVLLVFLATSKTSKRARICFALQTFLEIYFVQRDDPF